MPFHPDLVERWRKELADLEGRLKFYEEHKIKITRTEPGRNPEDATEEIKTLIRRAIGNYTKMIEAAEK